MYPVYCGECCAGVCHVTCQIKRKCLDSEAIANSTVTVSSYSILFPVGQTLKPSLLRRRIRAYQQIPKQNGAWEFFTKSLPFEEQRPEVQIHNMSKVTNCLTGGNLDQDSSFPSGMEHPLCVQIWSCQGKQLLLWVGYSPRGPFLGF